MHNLPLPPPNNRPKHRRNPLQHPEHSPMAIQKRPVSPRQKMINLMYVVLMAMLALNVSTDVLKGFSLVGNSLDRTITTTEQENKDLLDDLQAQYRKNPVKVQPWWDKAQAVQRSADSLCRYIDELKWAIARETDGADGNPKDIQHKDAQPRHTSRTPPLPSCQLFPRFRHFFYYRSSTSRHCCRQPLHRSAAR